MSARWAFGALAAAAVLLPIPAAEAETVPLVGQVAGGGVSGRRFFTAERLRAPGSAFESCCYEISRGAAEARAGAAGVDCGEGTNPAPDVRNAYLCARSWRSGLGQYDSAASAERAESVASLRAAIRRLESGGRTGDAAFAVPESAQMKEWLAAATAPSADESQNAMRAAQILLPAGDGSERSAATVMVPLPPSSWFGLALLAAAAAARAVRKSRRSQSV